MGSLGVALCLKSCVFVMLLPLGAKALPLTHSERSKVSNRYLKVQCIQKVLKCSRYTKGT